MPKVFFCLMVSSWKVFDHDLEYKVDELTFFLKKLL
jgi:hypothetical protein